MKTVGRVVVGLVLVMALVWTGSEAYDGVIHVERLMRVGWHLLPTEQVIIAIIGNLLPLVAMLAQVWTILHGVIGEQTRPTDQV